MAMFEVAVVYVTRSTVVDGQPRREVLLGRKLTGLGTDRLVGPGGKLEPGESARDAAVREVAEEVGLTIDPADLVPIGEIAYPFVDEPHWSQFSYAFTTDRFDGEVRASDELEPVWCPLDALPVDRMWADAALWLPRALRGEFVRATLHFGVGDRVVRQEWGVADRS
ncbi:8-oxo-dGTP diphosphatase [Microcella alkaliphila]|uniref:8-oxo-dGTP diphosphatase n=1 Tax=Microcella alkaliphila TaxID=279828 RepID=A0A4Q7TGQ1_9MICO|nr:8-oxo-dGTP diphosphatase [Microcella alkaliphila]RZT59167.1 8-oxo-dGTP diphosphatase [Microcella alkaliphila]